MKQKIHRTICGNIVEENIAELKTGSYKNRQNAHHICTGQPEYFGGEKCLAKKVQANLRKPQKTAVLQAET